MSGEIEYGATGADRAVVGKSSHPTEATRRHLTIQTERAMLVKALVAEGKTDEEIAAQLVVTPEQAALMVTYCTKDTKPTSEPYMRLPFNWRETHLEHECRECLEHYGLSSLRSAALRRAAPR